MRHTPVAQFAAQPREDRRVPHGAGFIIAALYALPFWVVVASMVWRSTHAF